MGLLTCLIECEDKDSWFTDHNRYFDDITGLLCFLLTEIFVFRAPADSDLLLSLLLLSIPCGFLPLRHRPIKDFTHRPNVRSFFRLN